MNYSELIALVARKGPASTLDLLPYTDLTRDSLTNRLTRLKNKGDLKIADRCKGANGGNFVIWACAEKCSSSTLPYPQRNSRRDARMKAYAANMAFKTTWVGGNPFEKETCDTHQPSSAE